MVRSLALRVFKGAQSTSSFMPIECPDDEEKGPESEDAGQAGISSLHPEPLHMALGGHPSSSMSSATATSSTAATSATYTQSHEDSGASKGANYFFGFLITFIVLLFFFIGCGVATRRRVQRRRIINLDALASMPGFFGSKMVFNPEEKPALFERHIELNDEATWASVQPLSVSNVTAECPVSAPYSPVCLQPSRNTNAINGLSLPVWVTQNAKPAPADDAPAEEDSVLQIAVLITMPHTPATSDTIPEYQIGVAQLQRPRTS